MADRRFRTLYLEEIDGTYEYPEVRDAWEHYILLCASLEEEPLTDERLAEIGRILPAVQ